MIKIFGKMRYHWQPELSWAMIYWSLTLTPMFISLSLLYERARISEAIFIMLILFFFLLAIGFHRYFVIEDEKLYIASANPFMNRKIDIDSIAKIEVTYLFIKIFSDAYPKGKIFYMRKWPKKYFINDLVRHSHFQGEIELTDHMITQDYFEEYYSKEAKSVR